MKLLLALIAFLPLSSFASNSKVVKFHKSEIEAVQSFNGTYARFEDISEGYESFSGIVSSKDSIYVDIEKSRDNTVILKDGSQFNQAILKTGAVVVGGDMGGGGTVKLVR